MLDYYLNRKSHLSHGMHNQRTQTKQRTVAFLRLMVIFLALFFYFIINYHLGMMVLLIGGMACVLGTAIYCSETLSNWMANHQLLEFLMDEMIIFAACLYSGGLNSPYVLAFFLPVLVHAAVPMSWEMLVVLLTSIISMAVLNVLTTPDWYLFMNLSACLAIAGAFINVLVYNDFKILSSYATHDGLTGLYTHQFFYDQLHSMINNPDGCESFSLIMIDLDEFKRLNDDHGHLEGDRVLREIAKAIQVNVRDSDIVARYGGDEFAIILPGMGYHLCRSIVERLRSAITDLGYFDHVSIGAALFPDEAVTVEDLVNMADTRMYNQKKTHKSAAGDLPL